MEETLGTSMGVDVELAWTLINPVPIIFLTEHTCKKSDNESKLEARSVSNYNYQNHS